MYTIVRVYAFMVTRFEYNYNVFLYKLLETVYPRYIFWTIVKCLSYKLSIIFTEEYDLN